jgi:hypothetical protein
MSKEPLAHGLSAEDRVRLEIPLMSADDKDVATALAEARASAPTHAAEFRNVRTYCMFIGYPRSGHSIFGSMLDAHPDALIAHELNALRFFEAGCSVLELYDLVLRNSREFTELGRHWGDYEYKVEGQWQGRYRRLEVIGDKKGGTSSHMIGARPALLEELLRLLPVPVRFVHVVRNPYDNIATIARKDTHDLKKAIGFYFNLCRVNARIIDRMGAGQVLTLRHEDLIAEPTAQLRRLAQFLELEQEAGWLSACSAIVAGKPHRSRDDIQWGPAALAAMEKHLPTVSFLRGYEFAR